MGRMVSYGRITGVYTRVLRDRSSVRLGLDASAGGWYARRVAAMRSRAIPKRERELDDQLLVRVATADKELIRRAAKLDDRDVSSWIRRLAIFEARRVIREAERLARDEREVRRPPARRRRRS